MLNKEKYPLYKNIFESATKYQLDIFLNSLSEFLNKNKNKKIEIKILIDEFIKHIPTKNLNTDSELKPNEQQLKYIEKLNFKTDDNQIGGIWPLPPPQDDTPPWTTPVEVDMQALLAFQRALRLQQDDHARLIQQVRALGAEANAGARAAEQQMNFYLTIVAILFVVFMMTINSIEFFQGGVPGRSRGGTGLVRNKWGCMSGGGDSDTESEYIFDPDSAAEADKAIAAARRAEEAARQTMGSGATRPILTLKQLDELAEETKASEEALNRLEAAAEAAAAARVGQMKNLKEDPVFLKELEEAEEKDRMDRQDALRREGPIEDYYSAPKQEESLPESIPIPKAPTRLGNTIRRVLRRSSNNKTRKQRR